MLMRAAVYAGSGTIQVESRAVRDPGPGEVQIEVAYTGICGTDLHIFHGDMDGRVSTPAQSLTVGAGFVNPLGFHEATPTFSWKLPSGVKRQTAYRLEVSAGKILWDSGWTTSEQSTFVPYGGKPLASRQRVTWRVCFRDEKGGDSGWSAPASVEIGLLSTSDW